jgi:hypothetical protein
MQTIEAWCIKELQTVQNAQSIKTKSGSTVYLSKLLKPKIEDPEVCLKFLADNNLFHMLDLRLNVTAMEEFLEANQSLPPGTSARRETFARVRK